jgi:hypothetical protein
MIDPAIKAVFEVHVAKAHAMADIKTLCGFHGTATFIYLDRTKADAFVVDDEALLQLDPGPFWKPRGYDQPIAGRAVLMGLTYPDGDFADCDFSSQEIEPAIEWPNVRFVRMDYSEGTIDHPIFGKMVHMKHTPIFEEIEE